MPSEDENEEDNRDTLTQFEDFVSGSVLEYMTPPEDPDVDAAAG